VTAAPKPSGQELKGNDLILRDEERLVIRTPEEYLTAVGMSLECLKADGDSEFVVTRQRLNQWDGKFQVELHLTRRVPIAVTMPALSAARVVIQSIKRVPTVSGGVKRALVLPDMQIGYRRDLKSGALVEFHDRNAIHVAIQIIADVKPDVVVLLGDNLDLPEWSDKYVRSPEMYFTTEPAKLEYTHIIGQIRLAAPNITYLGAATFEAARPREPETAPSPSSPDFALAAGALETIHLLAPLDIETLDLLIRTLRLWGPSNPAALDRARELERLARAIVRWELTRLEGARTSPLYRRAFIEDRWNHYQASPYH